MCMSVSLDNITFEFGIPVHLDTILDMFEGQGNSDVC